MSLKTILLQFKTNTTTTHLLECPGNILNMGWQHQGLARKVEQQQSSLVFAMQNGVTALEANLAFPPHPHPVPLALTIKPSASALSNTPYLLLPYPFKILWPGFAKLLNWTCDPLGSTSQGAGITGVKHNAWLCLLFLTKPNTLLTIWSSNCVSYLHRGNERSLCPHKNLYTKNCLCPHKNMTIYSSFIHNCQNLETTHMYFCNWTDKYIAVTSNTGILVLKRN